LSKDKVIIYILISLPENWSTISTIIKNQPLEVQTLDSIINTLNIYKRKLAIQAIQTPNSTVQSGTFLACYQKRKNTHQQGGRPSKYSKSQDSNKDQDNNNIEYWYCLKQGHFEKDYCFKKQADKKCNKRQKQEARVSLATASKATANIEREALISDTEL
jgi:hypothetical protein